MVTAEKQIPESKNVVPYACAVSRDLYTGGEETNLLSQYVVIFPGKGISFHKDGTFEHFSLLYENGSLTIPEEISNKNFEAMVAVSRFGKINVYYFDENGKFKGYAEEERKSPEEIYSEYEIGAIQPGDWDYHIKKIIFSRHAEE
jgi:hypothetical protein